MKRTLPCALALVLAAAPAMAKPHPAPVGGVVLGIQGAQVFIDLGSQAGMKPGDLVTHFRTITVTHPVTKKRITDRFPTGTFAVAEVEPAMSMGEPSEDVLAQMAIGDHVVPVPAVTDAPEPAPTPTPPAGNPDDEPLPTPVKAPPVARTTPPVDADGQAVIIAWNATLGQPPRVRVGIWRELLSHHPRLSYAAAVESEIDALEALEGEAVARAAAQQTRIEGIHHDAPKRVAAHRPVELAFQVDAAVFSQIDAAWVHFRKAGAGTFQRLELDREGDGYLRGVLPAEVVQPGELEYFVEVARTHGGVATAYGDPGSPARLVVEQPLRETPNRNDRSRVTVSAEYVDFHQFKQDDYYQSYTADFLYRWPGIVHSLRLGAGVFRGQGGPTKQIDSDLAACRAAGQCGRVGFNYSYAELELQVTPLVATATRILAGLTDDGLGGGVASKLRIGKELGTNLVIGGAVASEMGKSLEIAMSWSPIWQLPMTAGVEISNQPSGSDTGVRMTYDLAWRGFRVFQPTLRLSYSARTVHHAGFGGGLGAVFAW